MSDGSLGLTRWEQESLRLGELCAGYGGLGMAVEEVFGATTAWFSEYDAAPSKILAHHWPTVPNYGDMTAIDWAAIEPVDIISGGTPCQDLSAAGRRAGMNEGTRSNLWVQMREAIAIQRPRYVVWENVRGAFSAEASSSVEQCPGCVGDTADGRVFLRALGRVLGDLSDLGYDCQWRGLRAADVGACHGRFRVFVLAVDAGRIGGREGNVPAADPRRVRPERPDASDAYLLGYKRGWEARERRLGLEDGSVVAADTLRGGSGGRSAQPEPTRGDHAALGSDQGAAAADAGHDGCNRGAESHGEPEADRQESEHRGHVDGLRMATPWMETRRHDSTRRNCGADGHPGRVGGLDGDTSESRSSEVLPELQRGTEAEAVREAAGGSNPVPQSGDLRASVREYEGNGHQVSASSEGETVPEGVVRTVRDDGKTARPPQGQELGERRSSEPANALRELPSGTPLEGGPGAENANQAATTTSAMRDLLGDVPSTAQPNADMLTGMQSTTPQSADDSVLPTNWGEYAPAIARWERVVGRPAPAPTEPTGRNGGHRLSAHLTEWMMGLPDGWVTDPAIGITRNEQLKACGNGVVPQQAMAALRDMLDAFQELEAAA